MPRYVLCSEGTLLPVRLHSTSYLHTSFVYLARMQAGGNNVGTIHQQERQNAYKCGMSEILMGSCDQDERQNHNY